VGRRDVGLASEVSFLMGGKVGGGTPFLGNYFSIPICVAEVLVAALEESTRVGSVCPSKRKR